MKIVCIGDSITWGAWDEDGGWVARMRRRVDKLCIDSNLEQFILTYNYGISSDTTRQVVERLPSTIEALSTEDHEFAFIISLGTNDSIWFNTKEPFWVPIDEYESNLETIVDMAQRYSDKVLLLGSLPVDESKTQPYRAEPDLKSSNLDIARYEASMKAVAAAKRVHFTPLFELVEPADLKDFLFSDGVHPNATGHQLIADTVWPTVSSWIGNV